MSTGVEPNPDFLAPAELIAGLAPVPLPGGPPQVVLLDPVEPSPMRRALAGVAAGVSPSGVMATFIVACSEVVTNAIRYGQRPVEVQIWAGHDGIVVSIHDSGPGPRDPLLGLLPPKPEQIGGYGMWIARSWSDWLNVLREPTGCEVRLGLDPKPLTITPPSRPRSRP
jgi:anti-sigma regulatory factor (Ser/Thr protein kinase)